MKLALLLNIFIVFISLFGAAFAQADFKEQGLVHLAIANGSEVPFQVSAIHEATPRLYILDESDSVPEEKTCTGVLIAEDAILTAAHCLDAKPEDLTIHAAFSNYDVAVKSFVVHPQYTDLKFEKIKGKQVQVGGFNDIALIFLDRPQRHLRPAFLPSPRARLNDFTEVTIAGYGLTEPDGETNDVLRWAKAPAKEASHSRLEIIGKRTTCTGDSGGPVYLRKGDSYMVVGITSTGDCLGEAFPTRVADFVEWIQKEIEKFHGGQDI